VQPEGLGKLKKFTSLGLEPSSLLHIALTTTLPLAPLINLYIIEVITSVTTAFPSLLVAW
jgi:hypothetical protein